MLTRRLTLAALALLAAASIGFAEPDVPREPQARVEYHVRHATEIADHFDTVLQQDCPRFDSANEWDAYVDTEVDRVVLLVAHVEQAWVEAKMTGDKEVRRAAKAPRRQAEITLPR